MATLVLLEEAPRRRVRDPNDLADPLLRAIMKAERPTPGA